MSVDVLVGMQFGSEGKGKVSAYLAKDYVAMVRSGGPQAGHTFFHDGIKYINRQVPCGVFGSQKLYICAGAAINLSVLKEEITRYSLTDQNLMIHGNAVIVTPSHGESERVHSLRERIGSTLEGVGAAYANKIWRSADLFRDVAAKEKLEGFLGDTVSKLHEHIKKNETVLIEGTQGFGLSLNHGVYPFVTSKDVTASALLSDAGLPPSCHRKTIGVMRTYPIRVGGNSGPVGGKELTWDELTHRSCSKIALYEKTTVTNRIRRVFEQDYDVLRDAICVNAVSEIALMHLDYIDAKDYGKKKLDDLSRKGKSYVRAIEKLLGVTVILIGTGPNEEHIIDLRTCFF